MAGEVRNLACEHFLEKGVYSFVEIPGIMKGAVAILRNHLLPYWRKIFGRNDLFQHNNDPKQSSSRSGLSSKKKLLFRNGPHNRPSLANVC